MKVYTNPRLSLSVSGLPCVESFSFLDGRRLRVLSSNSGDVLGDPERIPFIMSLSVVGDEEERKEPCGRGAGLRNTIKKGTRQ